MAAQVAEVDRAFERDGGFGELLGVEMSVTEAVANPMVLGVDLHRGAKVIATDSPALRCEFCRKLGADLVVDYREEDFVEIVRKAGGANVILDIVGGPNIERNLKAATHDARIIQLAFAQGSKVEINLMPVMLKRLTYTGSTLRTRPTAFKTRVARELEEKVWPLIGSEKSKPVVNATFALADAAKAHALMESSTHLGKIVLKVG